MSLSCYRMNSSSDRFFREYGAVMAIADLSKGVERKEEDIVNVFSDTSASNVIWSLNT